MGNDTNNICSCLSSKQEKSSQDIVTDANQAILNHEFFGTKKKNHSTHKKKASIAIIEKGNDNDNEKNDNNINSDNKNNTNNIGNKSTEKKLKKFHKADSIINLESNMSGINKSNHNNDNKSLNKSNNKSQDKSINKSNNKSTHKSNLKNNSKSNLKNSNKKINSFSSISSSSSNSSSNSNSNSKSSSSSGKEKEKKEEEKDLSVNNEEYFITEKIKNYEKVFEKKYDKNGWKKFYDEKDPTILKLINLFK